MSTGFVSTELDDEDQVNGLPMAASTGRLKTQYAPWMQVTLKKDVLEKLNLEDDVDKGDTVVFTAIARVVDGHEYDDYKGEEQCDYLLQIEKIKVLSVEEEPGDEGYTDAAEEEEKDRAEYGKPTEKEVGHAEGDRRRLRYNGPGPKAQHFEQDDAGTYRRG